MPAISSVVMGCVLCASALEKAGLSKKWARRKKASGMPAAAIICFQLAGLSAPDIIFNNRLSVCKSPVPFSKIGSLRRRPS